MTAPLPSTINGQSEIRRPLEASEHMKRPRSLKQKLSDALPLSFKLSLKRVLRDLGLGGARDAKAAAWRDTLARGHGANDPARAARGPYVFVFDDRVPTPDRDAGSARMLFILKSLAEWSRPVFVPLRSAWPEYERLLWEEGVETVGPLDYGRLLKRRKFHAAILSRPEVAAGFLPSLRRRDPSLKIVYDMVDAHFVRLAREHELTGDPETAREAARYRKTETRLARASDLVWCASTEDAKAIAREAPGVRTVVVPTIHQP